MRLSSVHSPPRVTEGPLQVRAEDSLPFAPGAAEWGVPHSQQRSANGRPGMFCRRRKALLPRRRGAVICATLAFPEPP